MGITARPAPLAAQHLRATMPEEVEVDAYRLRMNHQHNAIILSHRTCEFRWLFLSHCPYSLFLLLLQRLMQHATDPRVPDFVTVEEALRVTDLWTGESTPRAKRNLDKHLYHLRANLAPWFEVQTLISGRALGYRLISTAYGSPDDTTNSA